MKNSNSKKLPTKEFQKNSSNTAWMFLQELKQEGCEISTTGHIYPKGKKAQRYDYINHSIPYVKGDHRLKIERKNKRVVMEVWDGTQWTTAD